MALIAVHIGVSPSRGSGTGHADRHRRGRDPDLRKSLLAAFWSLPFTSDTGRDDLLAALNVIRRLDQGAIKALPEDVPTDFVPAEPVRNWPVRLRGTEK
jgi:hypothetical protein